MIGPGCPAYCSSHFWKASLRLLFSRFARSRARTISSSSALSVIFRITSVYRSAPCRWTRPRMLTFLGLRGLGAESQIRAFSQLPLSWANTRSGHKSSCTWDFDVGPPGMIVIRGNSCRVRESEQETAAGRMKEATERSVTQDVRLMFVARTNAASVTMLGCFRSRPDVARSWNFAPGIEVSQEGNGTPPDGSPLPFRSVSTAGSGWDRS